jgi:GTPase SAR1 family protein
VTDVRTWFSLYRGANGVFLVYSVADPGSFNQCASWLREVRNQVDDSVPIMLIGNQVDRVAERAVQTSDAEAFARKLNQLAMLSQPPNMRFCFQLRMACCLQKYLESMEQM